MCSRVLIAALTHDIQEQDHCAGPASIMYSTAEATSPDIGPPWQRCIVSSALFFDLRCRVIHSRSLAASNVDLGQRSTVSSGNDATPGAIRRVSRPPSIPRPRERNDRTDKEADNSCASVPPTTPRKDDEVWASSGPRPMTSGFTMLSNMPTMPRKQRQAGAPVVKSLSIQIQMITGKQDDCPRRSGTIVRSITAKANRAGGRETPASLKAGIPASKDWMICDADDALGYRADGCTRQFQEMFALLGHDAMGRKSPLPAVTSCEAHRERERPASQRHRQEKI